MREANGPAGAGSDDARRKKPRRYADVAGPTVSGILEQVNQQRERLEARLASVGAVVAVASGKGGVGKSAVTANLAVTLARRGARVGVVDADLNGPSQGHMLGLLGKRLGDGADGVEPPEGVAGIRAVSTELLLAEGMPVRWRGPQTDRFVWQGITEATALREFLSDVVWGELDYLLVDIPPGTDKIGRFLDLVPAPDQLLMVTIPSRVASAVVRRSAAEVREARVACVALVVNMSGYAGEGGGATLPLFSGAGVADLARSLDLDLWAEIPFDPVFGEATDRGEPPGADGSSAVARALHDLAERVEHAPGGRKAKP
jgi:ATP-binding protein involved in chromosome partitioning